MILKIIIYLLLFKYQFKIRIQFKKKKCNIFIKIFLLTLIYMVTISFFHV